MTLIAVPPFYMLPQLGMVNAAPTVLDSILNSANEWAGAILQFPKTGTLKKVGIRVSACTQCTNGLTVEIETVDASAGKGLPNIGTRYATNSYGSVTPVSANSTYWIPINSTSGISVNRGDLVSIRVKFTNFATNDSIAIGHGVTQNVGTAIPYCTYDDTGGGGNKVATARNFNFGLEYDGEIVYCPASFPAISVTSTTFKSDSDPDERGLVFVAPYTCRLAGVVIGADMDGNYQAILYDSSSNILAGDAITFDLDCRNAPNSHHNVSLFEEEITLTIGQTYRIAILPTTTTACAINTADFTDDGSLAASRALVPGANWGYTTRNNGGTWTNDYTRLPFMSPLVSAMDDGNPDFPAEANVLSGDTVNGVPGTYHAPDASEVISTAVFGPNSSISGTYVASSGGAPMLGGHVARRG